MSSLHARRDFLKQVALGAVAIPVLSPARAEAAQAALGWDSKLMGEGKYVTVDGVRTRYFEGGQGQPLVLIHGGQWPATASADGWSPIFDHLAQRFHVYAFDKIGMGMTDNPKTDADYSMDAIIRHAAGFIQTLGLRNIVLAGHSRGALPAARIACDHPDLVTHLVIFDSNTLAPDDPNTPDRDDPPPIARAPTREEIRAGDMRNRQYFGKQMITDRYVDAQFRIAQLPKIREVDVKFRELRDRWIRENKTELENNPNLGSNMGATTWWMYKAKYATLDKIKAGGIKAPTIIIWGFNDPTAPYFLGVNLMETLSKVVPRSELHILNQAGHFVFAEHPAEVTRLITGFVTG
jgi:2-hydroxy-6-oxo-6-(2'-carboxyphenyl)-hexa-2,4-dienoate hydrolase